MAKLAASVEQILPITDLIQGIAQQTNLSGAQRDDRGGAGGHGRQGLCRASPRKSNRWRQQSGKATEEIAQKISAVRETCGAVVSTISHIIEAIKNLNALPPRSRPGSSSNPRKPPEFLPAPQSAADSSRAVAANIVDLNGHADATYAASNEELDTTKRLFDHTRGVQTNVEKFLRHVRSA